MRVIINGKAQAANSDSLFELAEMLGYNLKNTVTIINGFQSSEDVKLRENDELVFIEKGKMPDEDEFEAMLSARHTPGVYQKVKAARVAVAGLGGLGSNIALMLARTGVGTLHLIDFDEVEPSNLNRQQYKIKHLTMKKVEALKAEIAEINPYIKVVCTDIKIDENNCLDIFKDDTIVCEAFDKADCKAMLVNTLLENRRDAFVIASSGMAGFEKSNSITTRKVTDRLYLCGDLENEARQGRGLMSPRVTICAAHQANAALRVILGEFEV